MMCCEYGPRRTNTLAYFSTVDNKEKMAQCHLIDYYYVKRHLGQLLIVNHTINVPFHQSRMNSLLKLLSFN
jgi:hypothetical protein